MVSLFASCPFLVTTKIGKRNKMGTTAAVYTFCDFNTEKQCQEILLQIEEAFKQYHSLLTAQVNKQRTVTDELWVEVQRYAILKRAIPCYATYPKVISDRVEGDILNRIHNNIKQIRKSVAILKYSLSTVELLIREFDDSTKKLDYKTESPFIQGNESQKPIFYYIETVHDIYSYFRKALSKINFAANLISTTEVEPIEMYRKILEPSSEFDDFINFFLCVCKRSRADK